MKVRPRRVFAACHVLTCVLTCIGAAAPAARAADPANNFPMNDEVREQVRAIHGIALSPDGRKVVASITETTANGGEPHLWLLAPGAQPRQLTTSHDPGGENAPQWAPDSTAVLYLARHDGARGLMKLPIAGGEAVAYQLRLANGVVTGSWGAIAGAPLSMAGFVFSPDGKTLAVWADDPESADVKARRDRKDDSFIHGEDEIRTHLYLVNPDSGAARAVKLTGKLRSVKWSYDSADLIAMTDSGTDEGGAIVATWRVNAADAAGAKLDLPNSATGAAYLPGRTRIAYTDQCVDDAPPDGRCNDLFVKDLASGQTRNLTRGFDGSIPSKFLVDRNGDLLMTIPTHMQERAARVSTKDGSVTWFDEGLPVVTSLVTNPAQTAWAMIGSSSTQPTAVFYGAKLGAAPAKLPQPAVTQASWQAAPSKLVKWQNDGFTVEGLLHMPKVPNGQRVPLVVNVHGGPAAHFSDTYANLVQMLNAEGWAVLEVNPRGSTAYGQKFLAANKNDLGGGDYRDIMTGVDTVIKDYPIDPDRMALIGMSYGGEMAAFVEGRTNRFKAIVSAAPVTDQFSEHGTEAGGSFYDQWFYGKPWEHFEETWKASALATVGAAKTPFLLLQGQADTRDPAGQSVEMWHALRIVGAPTALIMYPREDHGGLGANFAGNVSPEPWHGTDLRQRMFGFIRAAFAGDPDPLAKAREKQSPQG